jgi:3-hydroxy-9,10-secoandrosta-1,3,5(10)-triene-9,17-dione monooxygenase reductase component
MLDGPPDPDAHGSAPKTRPAVDPDAFRHVLGHFATGVTVVTALLDGDPRGVTVSAFMSVSLDPPLVLVALDQARSLGPVIQAAGAYAVSILGVDDAHLSECFAGALVTPDRASFCGAAWRPGVLGSPILDRAIASIECRLEQVVRVGDHVFLVGRVVAATGDDRHPPPLLYYRRRYHRLEPATVPLDAMPDL